MFKEIEGDLIELAKQGKFDVIAHGCNCFCTMGAGIALQMAKEFGCDKFELETTDNQYYDIRENEFLEYENNNKGNINKLGQIIYQKFWINNEKLVKGNVMYKTYFHDLYVVNCYTQYRYGRDKIHVDYEALTLCMRKINHEFKGKNIGLPLIGCGLAGGDESLVKDIMREELKDVNVTVVHYKNKS